MIAEKSNKNRRLSTSGDLDNKHRNRIKKYELVKASELVPHPQNWRIHTPQQSEAVEYLLNRFGYVDSLKGFLRDDGKIQLFDGHLRRDISGDEMVPVLITDLGEEEAREILSMFDPVTSMAQKDELKFQELHDKIAENDEGFARILADQNRELKSLSNEPKERPIPETFQYRIIVEVADEQSQRELLEKFEEMGLTCQGMIL